MIQQLKIERVNYPFGLGTFDGITRPAKFLGSSLQEKAAFLLRLPLPVEGIFTSEGYESNGTFFMKKRDVSLKHFPMTIPMTIVSEEDAITKISSVAAHPVYAKFTDGKHILEMSHPAKKKLEALHLQSTLTGKVMTDSSVQHDTNILIKCNEKDNKINEITKHTRTYCDKLKDNDPNIDNMKTRLKGHGHRDGGNDFFIGSLEALKHMREIVKTKNINNEQQFKKITISDASCLGRIVPHYIKALPELKAAEGTKIKFRYANDTDVIIKSAFKTYKDNEGNTIERISNLCTTQNPNGELKSRQERTFEYQQTTAGHQWKEIAKQNEEVSDTRMSR